MRRVAVRDALGPSAALAALSIALACAPDAVLLNWSWDRDALGAGEWWRLWTGHFVHYSLRHALLDAAAVLLLGSIAENRLGRRFIALVLLFAAPLLSLAMLWIFPDVLEYRGASGLATVLGSLAGVALWRDNPRYRIVLAMLAAAYVGKTFCDAWIAPLTLTDLPAGVRVAWQVHLCGIATGVVALATHRTCLTQRNAFSNQ